MRPSVIQASLMAIAAAPVMKHMRDTAYAPVSFSSDKKKGAEERIKKAAEKRLRKQQRNIRNSLANNA